MLMITMRVVVKNNSTSWKATKFSNSITSPTFSGFCYTFRDGRTCAMKEGNPFGPFWNHFNVTFTSSLEHQDLLWGTSDERTKLRWLKRYVVIPKTWRATCFYQSYMNYYCCRVNWVQRQNWKNINPVTSSAHKMVKLMFTLPVPISDEERKLI